MRAKGGLLWPTLAAMAVFSVLVGLGTWQMQRKAWKDGLIAQISSRLAAPAISLDEALDRARSDDDLEYARVIVEGRWLPGQEWHYWTATSSGPGWHIYAPLETAGRKVVIVNRGLVADRYRDPATRPEPDGRGVRLVGLARRAEVRNTFTPDNDEVRNIWYWRDLDGMAGSMPGETKARVVPFFVEAERGAEAPPVPQGGVTRIDIPSNHFQYAMTWYGLALTLIGVYGVFAWKQLRNDRVPRSAADDV
jgi:surfeit locus 1 family protein